MDPGALRHLAAARPLDTDHLPFAMLVLEGVVVDLAIIAGDDQVGGLAGDVQLHDVPRKAAMAAPAASVRAPAADSTPGGFSPGCDFAAPPRAAGAAMA